MEMENKKKKKKTVKIDIQEEDSEKKSSEIELKHIEKLLESRNYSAYSKGREDPRERYESPKSEREWWRVTMRDTPIPGTYRNKDFLQDAATNPIKATYNFEGQGRRRQNMVAGDGIHLLPGAYRHKNFADLLAKKKVNSSFKSSGRARSPCGYQDKELNIPPWHYNVVDNRPSTTISRLSSFKSQSLRFTSHHFQPREGPSPGEYNPSVPSYRYKMSSCFCSATPRFAKIKNKDPGPGTYEPTRFSYPQKPTLRRMAKMHGLFFSQTFQV